MQSDTDGVNGVVYQRRLNRIKAHNMESCRSWMGMVTNSNWVCIIQSETMKILFFTQWMSCFTCFFFLFCLNRQFNSALACMCFHVSTYSRFPSGWVAYRNLWCWHDTNWHGKCNKSLSPGTLWFTGSEVNLASISVLQHLKLIHRAERAKCA